MKKIQTRYGYMNYQIYFPHRDFINYVATSVGSFKSQQEDIEGRISELFAAQLIDDKLPWK